MDHPLRSAHFLENDAPYAARRGRNSRPRDTQAAVRLLNSHGANLEYIPGFLPPEEELRSRLELERQVEFDSAETTRVFVHGRWHDIPRRQCAYGDAATPGYRFSGSVARARPWIEPVRRLRDLIAAKTGFEATFVLANHYAHAGHHVSWHADDERDLDAAAPIASLSLQTARDFQFRPSERGAEPGTVTVTLEPGSLLLMHAPTNARFQHCLPKRTGARAALIGPRWNLTFRRMVGR